MQPKEKGVLRGSRCSPVQAASGAWGAEGCESYLASAFLGLRREGAQLLGD